MTRVVATLLVAAAVLLTAAAAASAAPRAWDGANPFVCTLQQAAFGAEVPDPGADPYCVEFDKRRQNVTELGLVDFLSREPARVAAASDKCFYFQSDHWRGSVVQSDGSTKTYEWDGHYFFDKAKGEGGAWVTNFNVNGRTEDPSKYPGIPAEYAQHMGPGTGGVRQQDSVEADPRCAERARREPQAIYAAATRPPGVDPRFGTSSEACRAPAGGRVTSRSIGPLRIRDTERRAREVLGMPAEIRRGFLRWCDDGAFLAGARSDRSGDLGADDDAAVVMVVARRGAYAVRGLALGRRVRVTGRRAVPMRLRATRGRRVRRVVRAKLRTGRRSVRVRRAARRGRTTVWALGRRTPIAVGVRGGRVRFVVVWDRRVIRTRRGLQTYLRRALAGA